MVVAVISPNAQAQDSIARALEHTGRVETVWSLLSYPDPTQLKELPQDPDGCIVFLDYSERSPARAIVTEAYSRFPSIKIIGMVIGRGAPPPELLRMGVRDVIGLPPSAPEVLRLFRKLCPDPESSLDSKATTGRLFAFLPAKPGAGATTLAVHTAAALARISSQRTLLIDFDFRLGMTAFLLKLPGRHSVIDALYSAVDALSETERLDMRWETLVNRRSFLDILGSAPQEFLDPDPERGASALLDFVRGTYPATVVDLPGEMREYELDTLRRASECFLVCTSDIGVMHMAQRKAEQLRALDLDAKTSVIVNRSGGLRMMSTSDVESIVQLPVRFSVANAEKEIAEATRAGAALEGRASVVTQIENIARRLSAQGGKQVPAESGPESSTKKLLDLFTTGMLGRGGR